MEQGVAQAVNIVWRRHRYIEKAVNKFIAIGFDLISVLFYNILKKRKVVYIRQPGFGRYAADRLISENVGGGIIQLIGKSSQRPVVGLGTFHQSGYRISDADQGQRKSGIF